MERYLKIKYPAQVDGLLGGGDNAEIVVQEKLDGANFRFTVCDADEYGEHAEEGGLVFGSRNTDGPKLDTDQFAAPIEYINERLDPVPHPHGFVFFGEAMIPHQIEYADDTPAFLLFDVYNIEEETYMKESMVERFADVLGLPYVSARYHIPVRNFRSWYDSLVNRELEQEAYASDYTDAAELEGFVFKNQETGARAKWVRESFREQRGTPSDTDSLTFEQGVIDSYVTDARIRKRAFALRDESDEYDALDMEMMKDLPEAVIRDFAQEAAGDFFMNESDDFNIGTFRSELSSRCASVLKNEIAGAL